MRAVIISAVGDAGVLRCVRDYPVPRPATGEVLIKVAAAGVNRADIMQRQGAYPMPPGAPADVPGLEVAGEIVALGNGVRGRRLGEQVCALLLGCGYAGYVAAPERQCMTVPQGVTLRDAAGLPETYCTVWANLFERGRLRRGEIVLVQGGTSGIGVAAIQLAKAFGATVIATAGSTRKCAACRDLGADLAVNYRSESFLDAVTRFTEGGGIDIVLDIVGGPYVPDELELLRREGRLVFIAQIGGSQIEADFHQIIIKHLTVTGSTLRSRSITEKGELCAALEVHVWPHFAAGRLSPVIDRVFALEDAAAAHRFMERGDHIGKILLAP